MAVAAASAEPLTLADWSGSGALQIGNADSAVATAPVGDPETTGSLSLPVAQTHAPSAVDQLKLGSMTQAEAPDLPVTRKAPGKENSDAAGRILAQLSWPFESAWMPQVLLYSAPSSDDE
jgi:hypothetical protein